MEPLLFTSSLNETPASKASTKCHSKRKLGDTKGHIHEIVVHLDGKSSLYPERADVEETTRIRLNTGVTCIGPENRMKSYEMGAWCLMGKTHRREKEKQRRGKKRRKW